jgi:hypothetical protein
MTTAQTGQLHSQGWLLRDTKSNYTRLIATRYRSLRSLLGDDRFVQGTQSTNALKGPKAKAERTKESPKQFPGLSALQGSVLALRWPASIRTSWISTKCVALNSLVAMKSISRGHPHEPSKYTLPDKTIWTYLPDSTFRRGVFAWNTTLPSK